MTRTLVIPLLALALVACAKPEPEADPVVEAPAPAVEAPEVEQIEYVDPLEAARAAQAGRPGDESWREGFDHRAPPGADSVDEAGPREAEQPAEQPVKPGPTVEQPPAPPAKDPPTFSEPLPQLDGVDPKSESDRHPPDAVPPLR